MAGRARNAAAPTGPTGPEEVYRALVARARRLRAQERVPRGRARDVGRHRLGAGRHARGRRAGCRGRARARDAVGVLVARERGGRRGVRARLGVRIDTIPIKEVFDRVPLALAELFAGHRGGRGRGEPPGAHPRQPADGAVEQVRLDRARHREQERVRRGLLHAVRRHGRRVRADQGRAEDARLRAGGVAQRADRAAEPPIPQRDRSTSPRARSCGPTRRTRTRCRPTRCWTRSSRPTSRTTWASTRWSRRAWTATLVRRVVRMVDRAEYKRRQAAPGVKITPKAFGRDRRLPITNRYGST